MLDDCPFPVEESFVKEEVGKKNAQIALVRV
jgi:hypothetical protein